MAGKTYATYGEQVIKAIIQTCDGSEAVCKDQTFKLGKIHRAKIVMPVKDPSKLNEETISEVVYQGIEQIKQKYPNINIIYLEVYDPDGTKKNLELIADMFDPQIAGLTPLPIAIIYIALVIAAILVAVGIVVGASRFTVYMATAPGKVIASDFVSTTADITKSVISAAKHAISGGTPSGGTPSGGTPSGGGAGGGAGGGETTTTTTQTTPSTPEWVYSAIGIATIGGIAFIGLKLLTRKK